MRLLLALTALTSAAVADAQPRAGVAPNAPGWGGPRSSWNNAGRVGPRWGGRVDGRWWGGSRAPGGWGAYRRPVRGRTLPAYWVSPNWYVNDWAGYGLPQPPYGYNWSRYYDDAVLIDGRGGVYDRVGGIGWDRWDGPDADYAYDGYDADAPQLAYPTRDRDGGLGGAAIGAVAGGVAGNLIAGRGNRLGGTLIGAGVGAAAGYAIDKSDRAGREYDVPRGGYGPDRAPPGYGAGYPVPDDVGPDYRAPGAPVVAYQEGSYGGRYAGTTYSGVTHYAPAAPPPGPVSPGPVSYVTPDGATVTTSTTQGTAGYYSRGYYYPGSTVTTVTVRSGGEEMVSDGYERHVYRTRRYAK